MMDQPFYEAIMDFFEGHPQSFPLFLQVQQYIDSLGSVKTEVMKTQISFGTDRKFAWVWMPQKWTSNRPASSITVTFGLSRQVNHPRITQAVEVRPGHWTHHVVIKSAEDFDGDVRSWLEEAHHRSFKGNR